MFNTEGEQPNPRISLWVEHNFSSIVSLHASKPGSCVLLSKRIFTLEQGRSIHLLLSPYYNVTPEAIPSRPGPGGLRRRRRRKSGAKCGFARTNLAASHRAVSGDLDYLVELIHKWNPSVRSNDSWNSGLTAPTLASVALRVFAAAYCPLVDSILSHLVMYSPAE